jgi:hypothetical protein
MTKLTNSIPNRKIVVEINSCKQCPYFKIGTPYSTDGWDRMEDWICTKANKTIQGGVEWYEESRISIPKWCPCLLKKRM